MKYMTLLLFLAGCSTTSGVMESEGGTYLISARAAPAAGGTAGANAAAHQEAQKFCGEKGLRPIVVTATERDTYQGAAAGSWTPSGGSSGGGFAAAGSANLRFRCQ